MLWLCWCKVDIRDRRRWAQESGTRAGLDARLRRARVLPKARWCVLWFRTKLGYVSLPFCCNCICIIGVLGGLLVVVLFAPIWGGSLGICSVCWMLCTALYGSTSLQQSSKGSLASSYLAIIFGRITSGVPWFLRSKAEPMQHPHQCWRWCRPW